MSFRLVPNSVALDDLERRNSPGENDFFGFPKVKWLQYTGKVGKCTSCRCQIFSGFNTPKSLKSVIF